jgi:CRP/FNR family transcriptional regulator
MNVADALSRSPCFQGLDRPQIRALVEPLELRRFERHQPLWREGESTRYLVFVLEGRLKLVRHRSSGRDVILDILGPGRLLDFPPEPDQGLPASVVGLAQGVVVLADRAVVLGRLQSQPTVLLNLLLELARDSRRLLVRIDELSSGSVESRLASLLLRLMDEEGGRQGARGTLGLPLSRQDLADLVDATIETTIRIMSRWNRTGLVLTTLEGFVVPDLESLEALVE